MAKIIGRRPRRHGLFWRLYWSVVGVAIVNVSRAAKRGLGGVVRLALTSACTRLTVRVSGRFAGAGPATNS